MQLTACYKFNFYQNNYQTKFMIFIGWKMGKKFSMLCHFTFRGSVLAVRMTSTGLVFWALQCGQQAFGKQCKTTSAMRMEGKNSIRTSPA